MPDILDTLPAFMTYWTIARELDVEQQIDLWASDYLGLWPDLLAAQIEDYSSQGVDWRTIARTRIFPHLDSRLGSMLTARDHLLEAIPTVVEQVEARFDALEDLLFLVHVGIGCGAARQSDRRRIRLTFVVNTRRVAQILWSLPAEL